MTAPQAMKAVLAEPEAATGPGWIFERKVDGIRCLAVKKEGRVALWSRNGLSLNARYPEVVEALAEGAADDLVLDGEVVAARGGFERLARRGRERVAIQLWAFDVLRVDGRDVRDLPLAERRPLLERAVEYGGTLRLSRWLRGEAADLLAQACEKGWEGLIAKRLDSPYRTTRSRDWLKLKCSAEQELVVGAYTAPRGTREELGALLVGYYDDGRLRYAGKVGTGFDRATLRDLAARLAPLRRGDSPFAEEIRGRDITWVEPELVAQVGFSEWTRDGRLRHPRFLGLREDKPAREVVREAPGP